MDCCLYLTQVAVPARPSAHPLRCVYKLSLQHRHNSSQTRKHEVGFTERHTELGSYSLLCAISTNSGRGNCAGWIFCRGAYCFLYLRMHIASTFLKCIILKQRFCSTCFENDVFTLMDQISRNLAPLICLFIELLEEFLQPNSGEGPRNQA